MARGLIIGTLAVTATVGSLVYKAGSFMPELLVGQQTSASPNPSGSPSAQPTGSRTIDGDAINTSYGPVQVQITVENGKITAVSMIQVPSGRNQQFTDYSIPTLIQETLQAQNANIAGVSGASHTSEGFIQSLASAVAKM